MLDLAECRAGDVVYDLGCGDGRVLVAAARRGARAVGYELCAELCAASRAAVQNTDAAAAQLCRVVCADAATATTREASIIAL